MMGFFLRFFLVYNLPRIDVFVIKCHSQVEKKYPDLLFEVPQLNNPRNGSCLSLEPLIHTLNGSKSGA